MKKILIVSATSNSNLELANELDGLLIKFDVKSKVISLEDYILPLYVDSTFNDMKKQHFDTINELTEHFINSNGLIICGPEYNGSIAPIITNSIAWISMSTDYWRDAFNDKKGLLCTSSGGQGNKFITSMKTQLEHLGVIVMPRSIHKTSNIDLNIDSTNKILERFLSIL